MPLIPYPDVPQVPGVPAVLREVTITDTSEIVNEALGVLTDALFGATKWGLYDENSQPVIVFDTFLGLRFRNSARISTFPVEMGTFSSFNKVDSPYDCIIRVAHSGDMTTRNAMLAKLESIKSSVDLYSVVTPEIVYPEANVVAYQYERNGQTGSSQLIVDIYVEQVRQNATAEFSETAEPDGAQPESNGQVQSFPDGQEPGTPLILTTEFQ